MPKWTEIFFRWGFPNVNLEKKNFLRNFSHFFAHQIFKYGPENAKPPSKTSLGSQFYRQILFWQQILFWLKVSHFLWNSIPFSSPDGNLTLLHHRAKEKTFSKENFLERKTCFRVNFWKEKNVEWNYFLGETCVKVNSWKTQPQHLLPAFNWHIFLFSKVRTFCPSLPIFLFQI